VSVTDDENCEVSATLPDRGDHSGTQTELTPSGTPPRCARDMPKDSIVLLLEIFPAAATRNMHTVADALGVNIK